MKGLFITLLIALTYLVFQIISLISNYSLTELDLKNQHNDYCNEIKDKQLSKNINSNSNNNIEDNYSLFHQELDNFVCSLKSNSFKKKKSIIIYLDSLSIDQIDLIIKRYYNKSILLKLRQIDYKQSASLADTLFSGHFSRNYAGTRTTYDNIIDQIVKNKYKLAFNGLNFPLGNLLFEHLKNNLTNYTIASSREAYPLEYVCYQFKYFETKLPNNIKSILQKEYYTNKKNKIDESKMIKFKQMIYNEMKKIYNNYDLANSCIDNFADKDLFDIFFFYTLTIDHYNHSISKSSFSSVLILYQTQFAIIRLIEWVEKNNDYALVLMSDHGGQKYKSEDEFCNHGCSENNEGIFMVYFRGIQDYINMSVVDDSKFKEDYGLNDDYDFSFKEKAVANTIINLNSTTNETNKYIINKTNEYSAHNDIINSNKSYNFNNKDLYKHIKLSTNNDVNTILAYLFEDINIPLMSQGIFPDIFKSKATELGSIHELAVLRQKEQQLIKYIEKIKVKYKEMSISEYKEYDIKKIIDKDDLILISNEKFKEIYQQSNSEKSNINNNNRDIRDIPLIESYFKSIKLNKLKLNQYRNYLIENQKFYNSYKKSILRPFTLSMLLIIVITLLYMFISSYNNITKNSLISEEFDKLTKIEKFFSIIVFCSFLIDFLLFFIIEDEFNRIFHYCVFLKMLVEVICVYYLKKYFITEINNSTNNTQSPDNNESNYHSYSFFNYSFFIILVVVKNIFIFFSIESNFFALLKIFIPDNNLNKLFDVISYSLFLVYLIAHIDSKKDYYIMKNKYCKEIYVLIIFEALMISLTFYYDYFTDHSFNLEDHFRPFIARCFYVVMLFFVIYVISNLNKYIVSDNNYNTIVYYKPISLIEEIGGKSNVNNKNINSNNYNAYNSNNKDTELESNMSGVEDFSITSVQGDSSNSNSRIVFPPSNNNNNKIIKKINNDSLSTTDKSSNENRSNTNYSIILNDFSNIKLIFLNFFFFLNDEMERFYLVAFIIPIFIYLINNIKIQLNQNIELPNSNNKTNESKNSWICSNDNIFQISFSLLNSIKNKIFSLINVRIINSDIIETNDNYSNNEYNLSTHPITKNLEIKPNYLTIILFITLINFTEFMIPGQSKAFSFDISLKAGDKTIGPRQDDYPIFTGFIFVFHKLQNFFILSAYILELVIFHYNTNKNYNKLAIKPFSYVFISIIEMKILFSIFFNVIIVFTDTLKYSSQALVMSSYYIFLLLWILIPIVLFILMEKLCFGFFSYGNYKHKNLNN